MTPAVTVRGLLDARPESVGLSIELLAGANGLERHITSPYIQKTGLALAGFHEYLQPGRILLFGESEVRFLESLEPEARRQALAKCFNADLPCLLVTGGAEIVAGDRARRRAGRRADPAHAGADGGGDRQAHRDARGSPRAPRDHPRRADRHSRPRRADRRRERHRQERVRARPGGARPSPRRRRYGGSAAALGIDRDRLVPGNHAPSHGSPRPRLDQHPRSVRRGLDAHLETRRARRAARSLGPGPRIRPPRPGRCVLRSDWSQGAVDPDAGGHRTQPGHPRRGGGAQSVAAHARHQRRARAGRATGRQPAHGSMLPTHRASRHPICPAEDEEPA